MFKSLIRTFAIVAAFIAGYMMPGLHVYSWTFKWMLIVMLFVTFLGIRFKRMKPERAHWLLVGANLLIAWPRGARAASFSETDTWRRPLSSWASCPRPRRLPW